MSRTHRTCVWVAVAFVAASAFTFATFRDDPFLVPRVAREEIRVAWGRAILGLVPCGVLLSLPGIFGVRPIWRFELPVAIVAGLTGVALGVSLATLRATNRFERGLAELRAEVETWERTGRSESLAKIHRFHGWRTKFVELKRDRGVVRAKFVVWNEGEPMDWNHVETWNSNDREWRVAVGGM